MSESLHTPAPWSIDKALTDNGAPFVVAFSPWLRRKRIVAKVFFDGGSEDPEVQANAALIAAAPETAAERDRLRASNAELLAALRAVQPIFCAACCPTVWPTAGPRPHLSECVAAAGAIANAESLTTSPPAEERK